MTERGIDGRPTLVANVETLAHVALIARHGGDWFQRLGTAEDPEALWSRLSGVRQPGVYEIALGSSLGSLLASAGAWPSPPGRSWWAATPAPGSTPPRWPGRGWRAGSSASWERAWEPGIVVALPQSACPVAETTRVAGWLADQSAGQCGPCVNGLAAIADELAGVRAGSAGTDALVKLQRWGELVRGRGACAHPDGAAAFVSSALRVFAVEFLDHMRNGPCDACGRPPVLTVPGPLSAVA